MKLIRINKGRFVPFHFRLASTGILLVAYVQVLLKLPEPIAIPLVIVGSFLLPAIWFSFVVLTIDNENKWVHDGVWVMGYKIGKSKGFNRIEKIFINKVSVSQTMNTRVNSHTTTRDEFQAYLKTDSSKKYKLFSERSLKEAEKKVKEIEEKLGI